MPTRSLALLSLVAILALVGAGCGGDGGGGGGDDDAAALLKRSFEKQVDSGDLTLKIDADLEGSEMFSGPISLSLSGPFASAGGEAVPQLDWDIAVEGQGQNLAAGVILTEDNAFVDFQGQSYEVGTALYEQFAQTFSQRQSGGPQNLSALGIEADQWLEDPTVEDGEDIGGDSTQLVTGTVDIARVAEDFGELLQSPAVRQRLESQGQTVPDEPTEEDIDRIEEAVESVSFEANVDEEDYVRRLALDVEFTTPEGSEAAGGVESGTVGIDYTLESVGGSPAIEAPADAAPITELLQRFGLGGLSGGGLGGPGQAPGLP